MSTQVRAPERPPHPARSDRAADVLRSVVAGAPERLLLALLAFSYVAAVAYVGGFFRPVVVLPAAVVAVAVAWWLCPVDAPRDPRSVWGSALSLLGAGVWFLANLPFLAERVHVGRDPDVYTLTALWLLDHSNLELPVPDGSTESAGFYLVDGELEPQGNHLVAGVSASVGWVFGQEAVFWGNLACGAAALLALYVLGRRLLGPVWAFVPAVALGLSLPMLEFSRGTYSEPLAMTFTFLGAGLLWGAWRRDRLLDYLLAGGAFGGVALARIDGTLPLIGVVGGLAIASILSPGPGGSRRRWAAPVLLLGSLPGVVLGFTDLYFFSGRYVADLREQFSMLGAALVLAAVLALGGAAVPASRTDVVRRVLAKAAIGAAALAALAFVGLLSRPLWYVGHGDTIPLVGGLQAAEGSPIDPTRTYAEDTLQWVSWYHGWPVVLVGIGGLITWVVLGARPRSGHLLWLAALLLPSAAVYFTGPNIVPDQIWAMRRFLPVIVPGLLLASTWVACRLMPWRRPVGAVLAGALTVGIVAWPLTTAGRPWLSKNNAGGLDGIQQACDRIDGRPTIVLQTDNYLPTVLALCDVPSFAVPQPTPEALADAREALGGGSVVLMTFRPDTVPWVDAAPPPSVVYTQTIWERRLSGPPRNLVREQIAITLGVVRPDGSVAPLD